MALTDWANKNPRLFLSCAFATWKLFILGIAILSPGIGYDTSTSLLQDHITTPYGHDKVPISMQNKLFNLVRWDAVYYSQMAQRGLQLEQEWAFGIGLSGTISFLKQYTFGYTADNKVEQYIYTAIMLSHVTHWAAVMLLFSVADMYFGQVNGSHKRESLIATILYITTPAGIFMSAPYAESTFACLQMLGYYLYLKSATIMPENRSLGLISKVLAGATFGSATIIRSNGILSGLVFLLDAIAYAAQILNPKGQAFEKPELFVNLQFTIIAGSCIAFGMFLPQYLAFQRYCGADSDARPWCKATLPSIFSFVQSHYWNVGFLRYWTLSNLPLFLIVAPQLFILIRSGFDGSTSLFSHWGHVSTSEHVAIRLALPQLVLAVLAFFSYHVQIISRLSSAYPFWYIWLAARLQKKSSRISIRYFIIYGIVQAALYASFLPPA